ncbi:hypothetical protein [Streptomyces sp. NPDC096012]|uniref:hypothetical protein n=1 Tax=Streptomyces sp. NPDC096012 TaxID=3155684 RepID=UPI00336A461C
MDDIQKEQEAQAPRDPSIKSRPLPLRRLTTAVAAGVALVGLSVGAALAATSGDGPGVRHGVTSTVPPDGGSGGTTDGGGSVGVSDGGGSGGGDTGVSDGGGDTGGSVGVSDGGSSGGDTTIGGGGTDGGAEPSPTPTSPGDLAELDRRITELDKKVDQLPTRKELADALRAFADELDKSGGPRPEPDPS